VKLTFAFIVGMLNMLLSMGLFSYLTTIYSKVPTNLLVLAMGGCIICWNIGIANLEIHSRSSLSINHEAVHEQVSEGDL
jgi:hypothetical protein